MKIAVISDTHNKLGLIYDDLLSLGDIDVLVHAGDIANSKNPTINANEVDYGLRMLDNLPNFGFILYVPGNHDTSVEAGLVQESDYNNIFFLIHDWILLNIDGKIIKVFGSPYTPSFGNGWAYNKPRTKIDVLWEQIPQDTDLLVTHGPPLGMLDLTDIRGTNCLHQVGCKSLLNHVKRVKPKAHVFGHIHSNNDIINNGVKKVDGIKYVNASIVDDRHRVINKPIIIEM